MRIMLHLKEILTIVLFAQKLGESVEWVPISSPYVFQDYIYTPLQGMTPPALKSIYLKVQQSPTRVDFRKPKTQTFYKSTLVPAQEPVYEFRYKVHDPKEDNYQEKSEVRVGDSVRGFYSVREPNGYIRLVKYVSDENGFKTQVSHHHMDDNEGSYLFRMTRRII